MLYYTPDIKVPSSSPQTRAVVTYNGPDVFVRNINEKIRLGSTSGELLTRPRRPNYYLTNQWLYGSSIFLDVPKILWKLYAFFFYSSL